MDNTEGSRVINQTFQVRKNLKFKVSDRQMAVILGSILGDGYIYPQGKICFEHGQLQKQYLFWKYQVLQNLAYPKVAKVTRLDKRTNTKTISWRFFLRQYFRPLRSVFYRENQKVIPQSLIDWLTPELLAVWYMDDGYLDKGVYPLFMTESFSKFDVELLSKMMKEKLDLEILVSQKNRIRIKSKSIPKFFQLIEPFIHESLKYKLP